jgi:ubiquinone/menaquinone biosynthesis C-methylase UbiE
MKRFIIETIRTIASSIPGRWMPRSFKYAAEYGFWKSRKILEGNLGNSHYEQIMLKMGGFAGREALAGKVIADFGCGPRGSLCWATEASRRIGIDVLVDQYRKLGIDEHDMEYVQCSEESIPLPDNSVDVLFTMNALDHVVFLDVICSELRRILRPGGILVALINLEEKATFCEPQTLTEEDVDQVLLRGLQPESRRVAPMGPKGDAYQYLFGEIPDGHPDGSQILLVRARKPCAD